MKLPGLTYTQYSVLLVLREKDGVSVIRERWMPDNRKKKNGRRK